MKSNLKLTLFTFFIALNINAQGFETTKNFQKNKGFFTYYYDDGTDKIYLEVNNLNKEFLYVYGLSSCLLYTSPSPRDRG